MDENMNNIPENNEANAPEVKKEKRGLIKRIRHPETKGERVAKKVVDGALAFCAGAATVLLLGGKSKSKDGGADYGAAIDTEYTPVLDDVGSDI